MCRCGVWGVRECRGDCVRVVLGGVVWLGVVERWWGVEGLLWLILVELLGFDIIFGV